MTFNNMINPNVIGVDIGCGVAAFNIGRRNINLEELDEFIYKRIPSGRRIHSSVQKQYVKENPELDELI